MSNKEAPPKRVNHGNLEHPNEVTANAIRALLAVGLRQLDVCDFLKISTATLHAHYKEDLVRGPAQVFAAVGTKIVMAAMRDEKWALQLIATRLMGWNQKVIVQPASDAPDATSASAIDQMLELASPEELDVIDGLIRRLRIAEELEASGAAATPPTPTH